VTPRWGSSYKSGSMIPFVTGLLALLCRRRRFAPDSRTGVRQRCGYRGPFLAPF